jgi:ABC-type polysaccharide/polyol phosphate export permease
MATRPRSGAQHDYWFIARELTVSAFKLRDQGTVLGFLWTLLQPLAMLSVLYWLFRKQVGATIPHYGLYLLIGIVLWTFFAAGTAKGLGSLVARRDLIDSVTFPRELIVVSSVLTVIFSSTLEFGVVLLFAIGSGAGVSAGWLLLPFVLLIEGFLVVGSALLLAPWYVYARDLDNIWNILLRIGFFTTPVFYFPERFLSPADHRIYMLNPVTQVMTYARAILLRHELPSLLPFVATFAFSVLLLVVGFLNFRWFAPDLAEHI